MSLLYFAWKCFQVKRKGNSHATLQVTEKNARKELCIICLLSHLNQEKVRGGDRLTYIYIFSFFAAPSCTNVLSVLTDCVLTLVD